MSNLRLAINRLREITPAKSPCRRSAAVRLVLRSRLVFSNVCALFRYAISWNVTWCEQIQHVAGGTIKY